MIAPCDLLVIAPHPDDELLGAAGAMARAAQVGLTVLVIVVTDGGRSDPALDAAVLARRRQDECRQGLARLLGAAPPILFLGIGDGELDGAAIDVAPSSTIARFIARIPHATMLVTDPTDGHPDHRAAYNLALRLVVAGMGGRLVTMPISRRVDRVFDPAGFDAVPVEPFAQVKREALTCHCSQIDTLTGFALDPELINAFCRTEYFRLVYDRGRDGDTIPEAV